MISTSSWYPMAWMTWEHWLTLRHPMALSLAYGYSPRNTGHFFSTTICTPSNMLFPPFFSIPLGIPVVWIIDLFLYVRIVSFIYATQITIIATILKILFQTLINKFLTPVLGSSNGFRINIPLPKLKKDSNYGTAGATVNRYLWNISCFAYMIFHNS